MVCELWCADRRLFVSPSTIKNPSFLGQKNVPVQFIHMFRRVCMDPPHTGALDWELAQQFLQTSLTMDCQQPERFQERTEQIQQATDDRFSRQFPFHFSYIFT